MVLRGLWSATWLAACLALAVPAHAQPEANLVLGRADADASGGWPVALWVVDGKRSSFVFSAPRGEPGRLPGARWKPVDAQALMSLERFGAPQLEALEDVDPCPATLGWGRTLDMHSAHWWGERLDLRHAGCAGPDCAQRQAWRIDLPSGRGAPTLPLTQLLPGMAARSAQWLVLYVVSQHGRPGLDGLPELSVPPSLQLQPVVEQRALLPLTAAPHFPAIHAALLLKAARAQGMAEMSAVLRVDAVSHVEPVRYLRNWEGTAAQREALGLAPAKLGGIWRVLLRLHPANRPAVLRLKDRAWTPDNDFATLKALVPTDVDIEACRDRMATLHCEPACSERVAAVHANVAGHFADPSVPALAPTEQLSACLQACEAQKRRSVSDLPRRLDAQAQRQQRGWQWVESLTGRAAEDWRRLP